MFFRVLTIALLAGVWNIFPAALYAQQPNETQEQTEGAPQMFVIAG
jgi:hypothetical protein